MSDDWFEKAACRGMDVDLFFPPVGQHGPESAEALSWFDQARRVCASCPVAAECDNYARQHRIADGVWAGRLRSGAKVRREANFHPESSRYTAAERDAALSLAERIGVKAAHRRTGISVNALKRGRGESSVDADGHGPTAA